MLSLTAEYALRAIVWLARDADQSQAADEIAGPTKIPRRYLSRVLQGLAKAGLIRSQPGPRGGYALARDIDRITILEVVNAVAPLERIRQCPLGLPTHQQLCPLHQELDKVYAATESALAKVTIAQLSRSTGRVLPLCDTETRAPRQPPKKRAGGARRN